MISWKQTTDYTCGPSCVMVYNTLAKNSQLPSEKEELRLWKAINPSLLSPILKASVGTPPLFLLRYLLMNGVDAMLVIHKKNMDTIKSKKHKYYMYVLGCYLHDLLSLLSPFKKNVSINLKIEQSSVFLLDIAKSNVTIFQNIIVRETVVHYVIIKPLEDSMFLLMDPERGEWEKKDRQYFENNPSMFFGYSIVIKESK